MHHTLFKAHYRAKKWTSKYHWNAWVSQVSLWYCTAVIKHNNSFEMMVGLFGNWVESLLFQLSYDGLYSGPGLPPDLSALTFTPPKTLRCIVSRWWLVWLCALFLRLHCSVFSSSPSALIIPPHANAAVEGLAWSHHRSINPALLPSTDYCTIENAGWSALKWWQSLFSFPIHFSQTTTLFTITTSWLGCAMTSVRLCPI